MQEGEIPNSIEELFERPRPPWMAYAACRGFRTAAFFPGRGGAATAAKALCDVCQVRVACREYAIADVELQGIWGGTSERERRRIRAARGRGVPAA